MIDSAGGRRWQDYPNTASNIAYLAAALYVLPMGLLPTLAAAGLSLLAFGSWRFHWTHSKTDNVLDRLGMFASLIPTAAMGLSHYADVSMVWMGYASLIALFVLGMLHDRVYSYLAIGLLAGIPIVINLLVNGSEAAIPLMWYGMGLAVWALDAERDHGWGWLHSLWHFGTALGFAIVISQLAR